MRRINPKKVILDPSSLRPDRNGNGVNLAEWITSAMEQNFITLPSGEGLVGGNDTEIQFNDGGLHGGDSALTWDKTTGALSVNSLPIRSQGGTNALNISIGVNSGDALQDEADGNITIGENAGTTLTSGSYNILIGQNAGELLTTQDNNICIGYFAGADATSGADNIIIGSNAAVEGATLGNTNVIIGRGAGYTSVAGQSNVIIGDYAGADVRTGSHNNVIIGNDAGKYAVIGDSNVVIGDEAGEYGITGTNNVVIGKQASYGYDEGNHVLAGSNNITVGFAAGLYGIESNNNIILGTQAVGKEYGTPLTGPDNIFIGRQAGINAAGASVGNISIGLYSGSGLNGGDQNVFIGERAGEYVSSGSKNVFIGFNAGQYETTGASKLYISNSNTTTPLIHGDFVTKILTVNTTLVIAPQTATAASALTPVEGMVVVVSDTNGTFTSTGSWIYEGAAWHKNTIT